MNPDLVGQDNKRLGITLSSIRARGYVTVPPGDKILELVDKGYFRVIGITIERTEKVNEIYEEVMKEYVEGLKAHKD